MTVIYGNLTGSSAAKYNFWLEITQNSRNISDNSSDITVALKIRRNDGYAASAYNLYLSDNSVIISVDGVQKISNNTTFDTRNSVTDTLISWTGTVAHSSDGSLSVPVSAVFTTSGTSLSAGSVTGTFTGVSIPRLSTMSLSVASVNPAGDVTATVTPLSQSLSHRIIYSIGEYSHTQTLPAGTLTKLFTVPQGWANAVTGAVSGRISVTLDTLNGSDVIGSKYYSLTLVIPDNPANKPDFTISLTRTGSAPAGWDVYLRVKSGVTVNITGASYKNGASYKSASVLVGGRYAYGLPAVFSSITASGTVDISVTVTDSRGFSTTKNTTITVKEYSAPTLDFTALFRCTSDGTKDEAGTYLAAEATYSISSCDGKNSFSVPEGITENAKLAFRKTGTSVWSEYSGIASGTKAVFGDGNITITDSYEVMVIVSDAIGGTRVNRTIGTAGCALNIRSGGRGLGIGKYCSADEAVQSAYDVFTDGHFFEGAHRVADSGENSAYKWIRFSDGTQIIRFEAGRTGSQSSPHTEDFAVQSAHAFSNDNVSVLPFVMCSSEPLVIQTVNRNFAGAQVKCWAVTSGTIPAGTIMGAVMIGKYTL